MIVYPYLVKSSLINLAGGFFLFFGRTYINVMKRMDNQNIYPKIKPTPSSLFLAFVLVHAKPILRSPKWNFIFNLVSCKAHGIFIIITDGRI